MKLFRYHKSFNGVVLALPESGSFVPPEIAEVMIDEALNHRFDGQHLIEVCQCQILRDSGLVATNASRLVANLMYSCPTEPTRSEIQSLYDRMTADGKPVYRDRDYRINQEEHQLRWATFYQPFFQKLSSEIDRVINHFGSVTVLVLRCDQRTGKHLTLDFVSPFPGLVDVLGENAREGFELTISTGHDDNQAIAIPSHFVDLQQSRANVTLGQVTVSRGCFLEEGKWSDDHVDRLRAVLEKIIKVVAPA